MRTALLNGRTKLKQTAGGLKLTSASGKQTFYEAAIYGSTGGKKNLYLIDTKTIISRVLSNRLEKFLKVIEVTLNTSKYIIRGGL